MIVLLGLRRTMAGPHQVVGVFTGTGFGLQRAEAKTYKRLDSARRAARTLKRGLRPSDEVTTVICAVEKNLAWKGRPTMLVISENSQ